MESFLEKTGKTIDIAIQAALDELHLDRDQVMVEVLEKPKSGFLGLGGSLARVRVSFTRSRAAKAEAFLTGLLKRLKSPTIPVIEEASDGSLSIELTGAGLGFLIGHRGDTLDAIQHIVNYAVNRGEEAPARVTIDAENYRAKRVEALQRLAQKMAVKAIKYKKNLALEPMNSYERHVIHAALQETPGISTRSVGVDPHRHVIVVCEGARPSRPSWNSGAGAPRPPGARPQGGGYGGGYRGGNNRSGGSRPGEGGYQRREGAGPPSYRSGNFSPPQTGYSSRPRTPPNAAEKTPDAPGRRGD